MRTSKVLIWALALVAVFMAAYAATVWLKARRDMPIHEQPHPVLPAA
jgi:hypothetical protein